MLASSSAKLITYGDILDTLPPATSFNAPPTVNKPSSHLTTNLLTAAQALGSTPTTVRYSENCLKALESLLKDRSVVDMLSRTADEAAAGSYLGTRGLAKDWTGEIQDEESVKLSFKAFTLDPVVSVLKGLTQAEGGNVVSFGSSGEPKRDLAVGTQTPNRAYIHVELKSDRVLETGETRMVNAAIKGQTIVYSLDEGHGRTGENLIAKMSCYLVRDQTRFGILTAFKTLYFFYLSSDGDTLFISPKVNYQTSSPSQRALLFAYSLFAHPKLPQYSLESFLNKVEKGSGGGGGGKTGRSGRGAEGGGSGGGGSGSGGSGGRGSGSGSERRYPARSTESAKGSVRGGGSASGSGAAGDSGGTTRRGGEEVEDRRDFGSQVEFSTMKLLISNQMSAFRLKCEDVEFATFNRNRTFDLVYPVQSYPISPPISPPSSSSPPHLPLLPSNLSKSQPLKPISTQTNTLTLGEMIGSSSISTVYRLKEVPNIILKIAEEGTSYLITEAEFYGKSNSLQGVVVPKFFGYFGAGDGERVASILLEDCGESLVKITDLEEWEEYDQKTREDVFALAEQLLRHAHLQHQDLEPRNVCRHPSGGLRLIDLEKMSQATSYADGVADLKETLGI